MVGGSARRDVVAGVAVAEEVGSRQTQLQEREETRWLLTADGETQFSNSRKTNVQDLTYQSDPRARKHECCMQVLESAKVKCQITDKMYNIKLN